jgi:tetratricopeptide (TPR) repeat protein
LILSEAEEPAKSLKILDSAARLRSEPTTAFHRGWAYLFSDAYKLALADFDAALRIDPGLGQAYSGRGVARVSLPHTFAHERLLLRSLKLV